MSIEGEVSWLARIRTRLTWEYNAFASFAEVIDSTISNPDPHKRPHLMMWMMRVNAR